MKKAIISGAVHGFLAVALGAFGAHALDGILTEYGEGIWDTAVQYQMFHAAGIILAGILMHPNLFGPLKALRNAVICMNVGVFFFSGSLFVLAITEIGKFGAITPIGGVFFLVGWILIIKSAINGTKNI